MQDQWMREGDAFLLVYSITQSVTFDEIQMMRDKILRTKDDDQDVAIVVVGNKCDLENERQVHKDQGQSFAKSINVPFFETSAKEKINNEACFYEVGDNTSKSKQSNTDNMKRIN